MSKDGLCIIFRTYSNTVGSAVSKGIITYDKAGDGEGYGTKSIHTLKDGIKKFNLNKARTSVKKRVFL